MKKWIAILLCLMMAAMLVLPAMAEGTTQITITPSKAEAHPGEELTFTVSVSGTNVYRSLGVALSYDSTVYDLVTGTCTAEGAAVKGFDNATGFAVMFTDPTAFSGTIGTFILKVKDGAALAASPVGGTSVVKNGDDVITSAVTPANVTVTCDHTYENNCTICDKCGAEGGSGHTWGAADVTLEPTCTTPGSATYTCTKCGATKTEDIPAAHKFDGEWQKDANGHWLICSACGAVSEKDGHSYGNEWRHDATNHWQTCGDCGYVNKSAHTPGPEATEFTDQVCTTCQRVLKASTHQCTWSEEWFRDDRGHCHQCTACYKYSPVEKHDYENECDPDCSICGYTRIPQHIYSERWSSDASGHWHACELCNQGLEVEPHVPGPEATLTTPQICLTCGYEIVPSLGHTHNYNGDWLKDADGHWKECTCGMSTEKVEHRWDEGVVTREPTSSVVGRKTFTCLDCGYERSESIDTVAGGNNGAPGQQPSVQKPGFPWWLIIVIVAVPVVAFCVYMIIGIAGGKKQEGKFSQKKEE